MPTRFLIGPHLLHSRLAINLRTLLAAGVHHFAHLLLTARLAFRSLLLPAIFLHPLGVTLLHLLRGLLAACVPIVHPLLALGIILLTHLLALLLLRAFLPLKTAPLLPLLLTLLPLVSAAAAPLLPGLLLTLRRARLPFGTATAALAFHLLSAASAAVTPAISSAVTLALSLAE